MSKRAIKKTGCKRMSLKMKYKNCVDKDIYLFHYFNARFFKEEIEKNQIIQINKFISTTCLKNCIGMKKLINENMYNSILKIRVNKGTPCIPIANNSNSCLKEYEIILKSQSKFKIIKVKKHLFSKIKYEIECELIKND